MSRARTFQVIALMIVVSFLQTATTVLANPAMLHHLGDVNVPVKAVVKWGDCTPQHCVVEQSVNLYEAWVPYRIVAGYVDAGINVNWFEHEQSLIFIALDSEAALIPLNTIALTRLETASEGDIPSSKMVLVYEMLDAETSPNNALSLEVWSKHSGHRHLAFGITREGRLLVAIDGDVAYSWTHPYYTVADNILIPGDDCELIVKPKDEFAVCAGDPWPVPPADIPLSDVPSNAPIEFSLWQALTSANE